MRKGQASNTETKTEIPKIGEGLDIGKLTAMLVPLTNGSGPNTSVQRRGVALNECTALAWLNTSLLESISV